MYPSTKHFRSTDHYIYITCNNKMKSLNTYDFSEDYRSKFLFHWPDRQYCFQIILNKKEQNCCRENPHRNSEKLTCVLCLLGEEQIERRELSFCPTILTKQFMFLSGTNSTWKSYDRNIGDWWCLIYSNYIVAIVHVFWCFWDQSKKALQTQRVASKWVLFFISV